MEDLVALGVHALNPVQVSARDMDTDRLKRRFGDRIAFWGAVDTQQVLPFGTVQDVRTEVRRRICDLGSGGGYVLAAVHNVQPEVPPENVVAMCEAARAFGVYAVSG
jgi:uroporphyrinogen decarboxylase